MIYLRHFEILIILSKLRPEDENVTPLDSKIDPNFLKKNYFSLSSNTEFNNFVAFLSQSRVFLTPGHDFSSEIDPIFDQFLIYLLIISKFIPRGWRWKQTLYIIEFNLWNLIKKN